MKHLLQNFEIYIGEFADYNQNTKVPGGPFLHPDNQDTYVFDQRAYEKDGGYDPFGKGRGYVWPFGLEKWVNLEGKFMHLVADMSAYTGTAADSDTVSVCTLSIFGTKYVRDDPLPTTISVISGQTSTITVPSIYSYYQIGNTLDIKLREKSDLGFISFSEQAGSTEVTIDTSEVLPGVYSL